MIDHISKCHRLFVGEAPQYDDTTFLAMKWLMELADKRKGVMEDVVDAP